MQPPSFRYRLSNNKMPRSKLNYKLADELICRHSIEVSSTELLEAPILSVCFLTYNQIDFVKKALDSVLVQKTDFPFEIIIGDDASSDGSSDIIDQYQRKHSDKIKILRSTENLGRHTGDGTLNIIRNLRACRGKYIAFLEGDDYWTDPLKLQKQVSYLEANPEFSACSHLTKVLEPGESWGDTRNWWQTPPSNGVFDLERITSLFPPFHTSSYLVKREILRDLPKMFMECISGDLVLYHLAASSGPIYQIPEAMSVYRKHGGGVTDSESHKDQLFFYLNRWTMFNDLRKSVWPKGGAYRKQYMRVRAEIEQEIAGLASFQSLPGMRQVIKALGLCAFTRIEYQSVASLMAPPARRLQLRLWSVIPSPVKTLVRSILKQP
jgi:glycosyltransferase involved in cell wall biosynthesis